jgi:hypothetical protein
MLLLLLAACDPIPLFPHDDTAACTDMGCTDGYDLGFSVSTPGTWSFDLSIDGAPVHCQATLPLRESNPDGCDADDVGLVLSGSALPDSEHSIEGLGVWRVGVETIELTVTRDDAPVWSGTLHPAYETLAPNGEACGPVCSYAHEDVAFE